MVKSLQELNFAYGCQRKLGFRDRKIENAIQLVVHANPSSNSPGKKRISRTPSRSLSIRTLFNATISLVYLSFALQT